MRSVVTVDFRRKNLILRALQIALVGGLLAAESLAQTGTIPVAWEGVWDTSLVERICGNPTVFGSDRYDESLCAGDPFLLEADFPGSICSGTITDTSVDYSCTFTQESYPGCMTTFTIHLVGTRTGDSYQAVQTIDTHNGEGCEGGESDFCAELTLTGTRTEADPQCDFVRLESGSWSTLKAQYR